MGEAAAGIVARLRAAGHEAFFVGGCVRDELLRLPLKDIDIATSAHPEQVAALFDSVKFVGQAFGVSLVNVGGHSFEVATFRKDGAYLNHRHPDSVSYGTIEDDAERRDFTVNALYEDPISGQIRDFVGGVLDMRARAIRCVGDPRRRFKEDALRLLRAVRFAARLGFIIERDTEFAMKELAPTIRYISPERQRDELSRILTGPNPTGAIRMMDDCGVLHFLLPEIEAMKGVEQGKLYHPEGDVFVHTLLVLEKIEPRTEAHAWAALLHDVGKPSTFAHNGPEGGISFHEHEKVGAVMARQILERFRFSNEFIDTVSTLVARHMMFKDAAQMRRSTLRRFLGAPTIESDLALHRADCLGSWGGLDGYDFCRAKIAELAATATPALPPSLITGHDLMALGMKPGKAIGEMLRRIQEMQLEGELVTAEQAREWVTRELSKLSVPSEEL